MPLLSIIIPAFNEEKNLENILSCLRKQSFSDFEVIVADAGSIDKSRTIAEKFGCRIVKGGLPAKGRNEGAKIAKGNLFLFLDSDVVFGKDFLLKTIKEFKRRKLDIASYFLIPKKKKFRFFLEIFYNYPVKLLEKILPHGAMGILVKREYFEKAKGFNEEIKLAEDIDFVKRCKKLGGKFGLIRSAKLFISTRRFEEEGWFKTGFKFFLAELYITFIGPIKTDIFKYRFKNNLS